MYEFCNKRLIDDDLRNKTQSIRDNNNELITLIGEGTGRSTLLNELCDSSLASLSDKMYIPVLYDGLCLFDDNQDNVDAMKSYYELTFSRKILSCLINDYYFHNKSFGLMYSKLNGKIKDFDSYLNKELLGKYLFEGEYFEETFKYSKKIISELKNRSELRDKELVLLMNRFDYINNSSKYAQEILSNYFKLFNQVIITSDDKSLKNNGKDIIKLKYKPSVILNMVKYQLQQYLVENGVSLRVFDDMINIEDVSMLYKLFNGNIKSIVSVYRYLIMYNNNMDYAIETVRSNNERVKSLSKEVKLYIK